jgi:hypothetical protein
MSDTSLVPAKPCACALAPTGTSDGEDGPARPWLAWCLLDELLELRADIGRVGRGDFCPVLAAKSASARPARADPGRLDGAAGVLPIDSGLGSGSPKLKTVMRGGGGAGAASLRYRSLRLQQQVQQRAQTLSQTSSARRQV